jgi:hypothetical protein
MAMVINITGHSEKSLLKAAKAVERYRDQVMANNAAFLSTLLSYGVREGYKHVNNVGDNYDPPDFDRVDPLMSDGNSPKASATLSLVGEQAVFVEFGAGIHYNGAPGTSSHDLGLKFGYTIGSYGMGQGRNEYWFYKEDGEWKKSEGTPTAMPLFKAKVEMEQRIPSVAKEAFRSK